MARRNVAAASNGGTASAQNETGAGSYPASAAIDGNRQASAFWASATMSPTVWWQVDFSGPMLLDEIDVITYFDGGGSPTVNSTPVSSSYGLTAYDVQYWDGSAWQTLTAVTSNAYAWRQFTTSVTTTKIRVLCRTSPDGTARLVEVEAWGDSPPPTPQGSSRTAQKPFLGAQIDPVHPFSKSLVTAVLWNEGCGTPNVLRGPGGIGTRPQPNQLVQTSGPSVPTWVSTPDGWAQRMGTTDYFELRSSGDNSGLWVPTDEITICIIRRKYDATLRNVPLCGLPSVWDSAECTIWYPSSSPVAFWGFGGHSAPNELVSDTLVTPSTVAERLVFHAGPRGSAIWQNGIKVASQSTAIGPRTTNTAAFQVNSGDTNDWIYLAIHSKQWSDDLCRWWSAEPYAHFASGCLQPTGANRKTARGRAAIQAAIAATVTTPVTTRRRRHYPYYHSGSF